MNEITTEEFAVVFSKSDGSISRIIGPDGTEIVGVPIAEEVLKGNGLSTLDLMASQTTQIQFLHSPNRSVCCIVHMGRLFCWCA